MPSDADQGILRDILRHIDLAERFARGHTFESFENDELYVFAVTRCLEVISEASRRLSDELKLRHPGSLGSKWLEPGMSTVTITKTSRHFAYGML